MKQGFSNLGWRGLPGGLVTIFRSTVKFLEQNIKCSLTPRFKTRNFLRKGHVEAQTMRNVCQLAKNCGLCFCLCHRHATRGEFRALAPRRNFQNIASNFDICGNFQRIKMKFYILIIFKKSYWNFSLSCSLIISLQDSSWDRLSDQKFHKWLVFNHKYAGSVNLGDSLKCSYFQGIFLYLLYYFVLDRPQFALMKLYNIRVLLNCANCWNFRIDKRNLDITVSASSNRLFFSDLLIIILFGAKRITIINVVHFLKKHCLAAFSVRNLIVFN